MLGKQGAKTDVTHLGHMLRKKKHWGKGAK